MHFVTAHIKKALDNAIITPIITWDNIVFFSVSVSVSVVVVVVVVMDGVVVIN
jgi:hypothetical protein